MGDADSAEAPAAGLSGEGVRVSAARWRRAEWLIFLLVLWNGVYFYNGADWNQFARYDMIFGYVEPGTVSTGTVAINALVPDPHGGKNTGDWARNPTHHEVRIFSNKAPGPSLAGIPPYYVLFYAERALGLDPTRQDMTVLNCYVLNLFLSVLPLALAMAVFHRMLRGLVRGTRRWALLVTLGMALGSLLLPYATSLWGHVTAAACVALALAAYRRGEARGVLLCGLWGGLAVLSEYSCAIVVAVLGAALLWQDGRGRGALTAAERSVAGTARRLGWYVLGGLPTALVYGVYHHRAFGSWYRPATFFNNAVFLDQEKVGGLFQGFGLEALWGLTFSPYRGLFHSLPWLLAGVLLLPCLLWRRRTRVWGLIGGVSVLGFFLMNLSFNGWHGGFAVGPRYLIPVLPVLGLLVYLGGARVLVWTRRRPGLRLAWALLLGLGLLVALWHMSLATVITPMVPPAVERPYGLLLQAARQGAWHRTANSLRPDQPPLPPEGQSFNLGERVGLSGWPSLLPWILGAALLGTLAWRGMGRGPWRRSGAAAAPPA